MESPIPPCPICTGSNVKRAGFTRYRKQRFQCALADASLCLNPQTRLTDPQRQAQILAACQERMSQRGVARVFGVSRNTVAKWLKKSQSSTPAQEDAGQSQEALGVAGPVPTDTPD